MSFEGLFLPLLIAARISRDLLTSATRWWTWEFLKSKKEPDVKDVQAYKEVKKQQLKN